MKTTICLECGRVFGSYLNFFAHKCEPVHAEFGDLLVKHFDAEAEIAELERMYDL